MWNQFRQLWTTSVVFQAAASVVVIGLAVLATTSVSPSVVNQTVPPNPISKSEDTPGKQTGLLGEAGQFLGRTTKSVIDGGRYVAGRVEDAVEGARQVIQGQPKP